MELQARAKRQRGLEEVHLVLNGGPCVIEVDEQLQILGIAGEWTELEVISPNHGATLKLVFGLASDQAIPLLDLRLLRGLSVYGPREVELGPLTQYSALTLLELNLSAGALLDIESLGQFSNLTHLTLRDCYDYDPLLFPDRGMWPNLESVGIFGLRKSALSVLRSKLAGIVRLDLMGAKTDAWLAKNAHNPFRDWADEDRSLGRAGCQAYSRALSAIGKLSGAGKPQLRAILDAFMTELNRIDDRHGLETTHRETAYDAYAKLVASSKVSLSNHELESWFDEHRSF